MGTVSNKGTITAIEGVLIETIDGQIRISTYDMTKGVRSTFEALEIERELRLEYLKLKGTKNNEG